MELWLVNHDREEWPDVDVRQTKDAWHVTDAEMHPPIKKIMEMCSKDFFSIHHYKYIDMEIVRKQVEYYNLDFPYDDVTGSVTENKQQFGLVPENSTLRKTEDSTRVEKHLNTPKQLNGGNCLVNEENYEEVTPLNRKENASTGEHQDVSNERDEDECSLYEDEEEEEGSTRLEKHLNTPKQLNGGNCVVNEEDYEEVTPLNRKENASTGEHQDVSNERDEDDCSLYEEVVPFNQKENARNAGEQNESCLKEEIMAFNKIDYKLLDVRETTV